MVDIEINDQKDSFGIKKTETTCLSADSSVLIDQPFRFVSKYEVRLNSFASFAQIGLVTANLLILFASNSPQLAAIRLT